MSSKHMRLPLILFLFIVSCSQNTFPDPKAGYSDADQLPDFSQYKNVAEKKKAFFTFLLPLVIQENEHILKIRENVIKLELKRMSLTTDEKSWLLKVAQRYKINKLPSNNLFYSLLLKRVDVIPASLALSQGALESAWGDSRFSHDGNNLFGQWCFVKNCGIVPKQRSKGKTHEVAKFDSINEAVRAYLHNLNTHSSYNELRATRQMYRFKNELISGINLAKTLIHYSEEGKTYTSKVIQIIKRNQLETFTIKQNK